MQNKLLSSSTHILHRYPQRYVFSDIVDVTTLSHAPCKTVDYHVCLNYMFTLPIITLQLLVHARERTTVRGRLTITEEHASLMQ